MTSNLTLYNRRMKRMIAKEMFETKTRRCSGSPIKLHLRKNYEDVEACTPAAAQEFCRQESTRVVIETLDCIVLQWPLHENKS